MMFLKLLSVALMVSGAYGRRGKVNNAQADLFVSRIPSGRLKSKLSGAETSQIKQKGNVYSQLTDSDRKEKRNKIVQTLIEVNFDIELDSNLAGVDDNLNGVFIEESTRFDGPDVELPTRGRSRRMVLGGNGQDGLPESTGMQASGVPIYHSKPGATYTLYLDFDGHSWTSGTSGAWGNFGDNLEALPYDNNGNVDSFSSAELSTIQQAFAATAEDFAGFDIDVTTEEPPTPFDVKVGHVLITDQVDKNGITLYGCNCGGVAYLNVFGQSFYHQTYSPALVFNTGTRGVMEAISHEFGHNLGLSHDGFNDGTTTLGYYTGHGNDGDETSWAPIMGVGYYKKTVQWSKGEYQFATQFQDDVAIIRNKIGVEADDFTTPEPLIITVGDTASSGFHQGLIEQSSDVDEFSFSMPDSGSVTINALTRNNWYGNLDIGFNVKSATTGATISSCASDSTRSCTWTGQLNAGEYIIEVSGSGNGADATVGYTDYSSMGQYEVSVTNIPLNNVDDCVDNQCQNGAQCVDGSNGYTCTCLDGFDGNFCENNVDDCANQPCVNGVCVDGVNSYTCDCTGTGFEGNNCESNVNDCLNNQCLNGAQCVDGLNGYTCACLDGFDGNFCDNNIDDCANQPCVNGVCADGVNSYTCDCTGTGFEGNNCENNVDDCANNQCQNGAQCVDGLNGYTCTCVDGFNGNFCENNIDDCANQPCLNSGVCVDGIASYTCDCPLGWSGQNCENNIAECTSNPCQNGGSCVDLLVQKLFKCECPAGFTGNLCEVDIDECASNPCNTGVCKDGVNSFTCDCTGTGFDGANCDQNIDDCKSDSCLNGGVCLDQVNGFVCNCPSGFTGDQCEKNVNDCLGQPCQNNGICNDAVGGYTCDCSGTGFSGDNCDVNIDDCNGVVCQNGGICKDEINNFKCECQSGFDGANCENNINDCESNPCANGGSCIDGIAAFECKCAPGWTGNTCEENINDCKVDACLNGGECIDLLNGFECKCPPLYTGDRCETKTTGCSPINPCLNDGVCVDTDPGNGEFKCECTLPYFGDFCEKIRRERCGNNKDDDGDGLVDCADPDCSNSRRCKEKFKCNDGLDNDFNGLTDCQDPECFGSRHCKERRCGDGEDNDSDGLVDCFDPDCKNKRICKRENPKKCFDGIDNDADGKIDCEDENCARTPYCLNNGQCLLAGAAIDGGCKRNTRKQCCSGRCSKRTDTCK